MKQSARKTRPTNTTILTVLLFTAVVVLAALFSLLFMMFRDYLLPAGVSARNNGGPSEPGLSTVAVILKEQTLIPTATFFLPLPTATRTSLPSPTPRPSPTWTPEPTATDTQPPPPPEPAWPPESALIDNISGYPQSLSLDCESRSAVDWAAYFGVSIGEFEFLDLLPRSDDPNQGFVGDPNGYPQLTPPYSYGVHAAPVARLLRAYGLPAEEVYGLDSETLKAEIASGQPVIAWVTVWTQRGYSLDYVTQAGETVTVALNEHTVMVIGYDPAGVTLLDGAMVYWRSWDLFLDSFSLLGNMAIISGSS